MKQRDIEIVLDIITLATQYGVPAVQQIMTTWTSDQDITPAIIAKLKGSIKPASELFDEDTMLFSNEDIDI